MHLLRRTPALFAALCALAAVASPASAADPAPFGHACTAEGGVRFCPTSDLSQRIPTFDGVPLDVDVTLPPNGNGPFPALVLMHGYGGNKGAYEAASANDPKKRFANNLYYAQRGYAVITLSARGFGRSCGSATSRTPDCAKGWIHLGDQRYEARDTQVLLGRLVDEGIVDPKRIGVSGGSYGGGQAMELAFLKNRVRLENGKFSAWKSPKGARLRIAAAAPVIPWSDLASALVPNGRWLDTDVPSSRIDTSPIGVPIISYINGLYIGGAAAGFVAPPGADSRADLSTWKAVTEVGDFKDQRVPKIASEFHRFHSAISIPGTPAPLLISNGWRDDLFPVGQALRVYNLLRARHANAPVSLSLLNVGHPPAGNKDATAAAGAKMISSFFDARLRGKGRAPAAGSVYAGSVTCPQTAPDSALVRSKDWNAAHPGTFTISGRKAQTATSDGGNPATGKAFDPIGGVGDQCKTVPAEKANGTAVVQAKSPGFTLLGLTTITAEIRAKGAFPYLAARLWEVKGGQQLLVDRGVVRLDPNQRGRLRFQLHGTDHRFARGSTVKLELLGRDANYYQASTLPFSVKVSNVSAELPTRERGERRAR
ncbi:MAG: alpha/beta fold hydrolase [Thermoleophilaceae bacterium]